MSYCVANRALLLSLLLAVAPASAKVTSSLVLCLPSTGPWLTADVDTKLQAFGSKIREISRTNRVPEMLTSTSVMPTTRKLRERPDLERSVVHRLKATGVDSGPHEH